MVRYRQGFDRRTGRPLTGFAHVQQSVEVILTTIVGERLMLLGFGWDGIGLIGQNLSAATLLAHYRAVVTAVHRWEPEFRIRRLQVLTADRTGGLSLGYSGTYFPEGRYGNYALKELVSATFPAAIVAAAAGAAA